MRRLRGLTVLGFAIATVACNRSAPKRHTALTNVRAIQQLTENEVSSRPEARLSGTVTVVDDYRRVLFIQDSTGALWSTVPPGMQNIPGGSSVELAGTVAAVGGDRAIVFPSLGRVGSGRQPQPRELGYQDLTASRRNYALGHLRMKVTRIVEAAGREIRLTGEIPGGSIEVSVLHPPAGDVADFPGCQLDMIGVPAPPTQVSITNLPLLLADEATCIAGLQPRQKPREVLTTVQAVKALGAIEARRAYPVDLRGVVTTSAPGNYMLTMQDSTGAIYLHYQRPEDYPPFGMRVRVEGATTSGDSAPSVDVAKLTVEGPAPLPRPANLAEYRIDDSALDNLWVRLDGVVRWVRLDPSVGYDIVVSTPVFRTNLVVNSGSAAEAARLRPGDAISVEGVYSAQADRFRHWIGFQVYAPALDRIRPARPATSAGASRLAGIPLGALFAYGSVSGPTVPVRVRGVVTLSAPDGSVYVSDGEGGAQVVPVPEMKPVGAGTILDVTGFLPIDSSQRRIEDATWIPRGQGQVPAPRIVQADSMLDGSYESRWVQVEGVLSDQQQAVECDILVLKAGGVLVNVYTNARPDDRLRSLRAGSVVRVTGVVVPSFDRPRLGNSRTVSVLVNSSRDIRVARSASWWTQEHLTHTLIAAVALLSVLFVAGALLVRRVVLQSRVIGRKLNAEAALKAAAEAASRAKSQFLASMSHEIRTPMNGILGLTELALGSAGQPEQEAYLKDALQSAQSLMGILNDVLDLAKIESGKMTLAEESFSISSLLHPVVTAAQMQCELKGVEFVCTVDPALPATAVGDAMRLQQIVTNLISNACKFTHAGRIDVTATVKDEGTDDFTLELHVRDTGIGIASDHIHRIFEAFEQVDPSDCRRYGGTGLGLAICRNLAQRMGGAIHLASELGHGSDFWIEIPLRRASPSTLAPAAQAAPAAIPVASRPLRILAAEDNRVNCTLLRRILELAGHRVTFAGDGVEALALWEQDRFDLVLMDLQMPLMDGLEATRVMRLRENGTGRRTPVIAVTARAMSEDRELTIAAGMDGYVSKPYSRDELLSAIQRVMRVHGPHNQAT